MAKRPAKPTASNSASDTVTIHDQQLHRGAGGELHQFAEDGQDILTTAQGGPVADDQNSLRVGARGPLLVDDFHFR
jgi:catalase